jgi:excisionase family DNA binding protein
MATSRIYPDYSNFEAFINLEAAARLLQLHPDTLKRKTQAGEIPGRKIGRRWMFRASELNAWAAAKMPLSQVGRSFR